MIEYRRKFLVPGDTIPHCLDYLSKCEKEFGDKEESRPCYFKQPTTRKTFTHGYWIPSSDESKCPYPINKPVEYIVSETKDGEWQCSCKAWTTHKPRIDCKHIVKAKADPKKYEVAVDWIGKAIETMKRVTR